MTSWPKASTAAFWVAFAVLLIGLFVALGGPAYAADELPSAASDQYASKNENVSDPEETTTPVFRPPTAGDSGTAGTTLPNTGLSLLVAAVIGMGLVSVGVAMRRRERRKT